MSTYHLSSEKKKEKKKEDAGKTHCVDVNSSKR